MFSQFLGFMLDAYDMALVLVMAPILAQDFRFTKRQRGVAVYYDSPYLLHNHGGETGRFRDLRSLCGQDRAPGASRRDHRRGGRHVASCRISSDLCPTGRLVLRHLLHSAFLYGLLLWRGVRSRPYLCHRTCPGQKTGPGKRFCRVRFPLGYVFASLVFALISSLAGKEVMFSYGWRIAFMTGALPVLLAIYIRRMLPESPEFEKAKKRGDIEKAPAAWSQPPALWGSLRYSSL